MLSSLYRLLSMWCVSLSCVCRNAEFTFFIFKTPLMWSMECVECFDLFESFFVVDVVCIVVLCM